MISPEHKAILEKTGKMLRVMRKEKKLSQKQMAFEMGIGLSQYELIEKGKVNFGFLTLLKLAEVLEVDPSIFFIKLKTNDDK